MKEKNMGRMEEKKLEEPKEEAGNSLHACKKKKEKYLGTRREIQVTSSILVALPEVNKKTRRQQIYGFHQSPAHRGGSINTVANSRHTSM